MNTSVIYADPPWQYDFSRSNNRKIENQYQTMSLDKIKNYSFPCAKNAVLFLWATAPKLKEALEVMDAWGFRYVTHAIWDKQIKGMGYWFRGQHELLLVGVRGKFSPPKPSVRVGSIFRHKRTKHSKKPNGIRTLINGWFPNRQKLELFSREHFEGWDVFGLEAPKGVQKLLEENKR